MNDAEFYVHGPLGVLGQWSLDAWRRSQFHRGFATGQRSVYGKTVAEELEAVSWRFLFIAAERGLL